MWFWIEDGRQCSYNGLRVLVQRVFGSLAQVVEMKQPCAITSNVAAFAMSHRVISSAIAKFHVLGEGLRPGELFRFIIIGRLAVPHPTKPLTILNNQA